MNDIAKRPPSRLSAYLALIRPPNIMTAIADVLAGYGVAGLGNAAALPWLLVATACLYGGGVVLNDVFDRRVDQLERPERPIPSGRVPAATAGSIGSLLLVAGLATAMLATSWPIATLPFAYIAAITALSRGEVHGGNRTVATLSLALVTAVVAALLVLSLGIDPALGTRPSAFGVQAVAGVALTLLLAWRVLPAFWRARQHCDPRNIRAAVRAGVLSLVLLDATIGAVYAGPLYGLVILALAPVAWLLARPFAVT